MRKTNLILSVFTLMSLIAFSGCEDKNTSSNIPTVDYEISLKSISGNRLMDVTIEFYENDTIIESVVTDYIGVAEITLPAKEYVVEFTNLPKGIYYTDEYKVDGKGGDITFEVLSKVIEEEAPENTSYKKGSVMYDFTFTDLDGKNHSLAKTLEKKKLVILNFWYIDCYYCVKEFPILEQISQTYTNIEIFALNINTKNDTLLDMIDFQEAHGLTFPMGSETNYVYEMFGYNVAPVSVMVNKYGVVTYIQQGAFSSYYEIEELLDIYL